MGIVYVVTNKAMKDDIVKIGVVEKEGKTVEKRMTELQCEMKMPYPFDCYYAIEVGDNAKELESKIHKLFADSRIKEKGRGNEFFKLRPERAREILSLFVFNKGGKTVAQDVTPDPEDTVEDEDDKKDIKQEKKRMENFTFKEVKIPLGTKLKFWDDPKITCEVVSNKKIKFEGRTTSLSDAAAVVLERKGSKRKNKKAVAGPRYWLYKNSTLDELRRK